MESQKKMMLVVFGLVATVLLQSVAAQTEHVVGGSIGWTIPQSGNAQEYVTWASGQKFVVGDVLSKFPNSFEFQFHTSLPLSKFFF